MPGPENTLLIEGSFRELVEELADFIDGLKKGGQPADGAASGGALRQEITPLLDAYTKAEEARAEGEASEAKDDEVEQRRDDVLKVIVNNSTALMAAPEKDFLAAFNLLIHLINQSQNLNPYLQPICRTLSTAEITSATSAQARSGLALSALTTIFNILEDDDSVRYPVFSAILDVIARAGAFDSLRPQLKHLDHWLASWDASPDKQRKMLLRISQIARDAGEPTQSYEYLVRALRTIPGDEASGDEARKLSVEALRTALASPTHFDFEDLTSLDSVHALRQSEAVWFQLLEVFTSDVLDDFNSFNDEHKGWLAQQELDEAVLTRKMRLLTIASLAAATGQARSLPYASVEKSLQIPADDVEMWVIDAIRVGLVEGKLSQLNRTFLIHRSTYRVFTENQWREVAGRLDMWRESLTNVLEVIREQKEQMLVQKENEVRMAEAKANGTSNYRARREVVDTGMD